MRESELRLLNEMYMWKIWDYIDGNVRSSSVKVEE